MGGATGPGTAIRSLRMDIRDTSEGLSTDRIALDVQGLGTATGDGTVSKEGALHYNMLVKLTEWRGGPAQAAGGGLGGLLASSGWLGNLAGSVLRHGIPVEVRGTTASPTFLANLGGLALGTDTDAGGTSGAWKGGKQGASGPQQQLQRALGRLLGKH